MVPKSITYALLLLFFAWSAKAQTVHRFQFETEAMLDIPGTRKIDLDESSYGGLFYGSDTLRGFLFAATEGKKVYLTDYSVRKGKLKKQRTVELHAAEDLFERPVMVRSDSLLFLGCGRWIWMINLNQQHSKPLLPLETGTMWLNVSGLYIDSTARLLYLYSKGYFSALPELIQPAVYCADIAAFNSRSLPLVDSFLWSPPYDHLESYCVMSPFNLMAFLHGKSYLINPFLDTVCVTDLSTWSHSYLPMPVDCSMLPRRATSSEVRSTLMAFSQIKTGYFIREQISRKSPGFYAVRALNDAELLVFMTTPDTLREVPQVHVAGIMDESSVFRPYNIKQPDAASFDEVVLFNLDRYLSPGLPKGEFSVFLKCGYNLDKDQWQRLRRKHGKVFRQSRKSAFQVLICKLR